LSCNPGLQVFDTFTFHFLFCDYGDRGTLRELARKVVNIATNMCGVAGFVEKVGSDLGVASPPSKYENAFRAAASS
jgi:hypothetical protein